MLLLRYLKVEVNWEFIFKIYLFHEIVHTTYGVPRAFAPSSVIDEMEIIETELRITMFCSGAGNVAALRQPGLLTHSTHTVYSHSLPTHGGERS